MTFKLMNKDKEVTLPAQLHTFRGKPVTVTSFEVPRHAGSTGRVYTECNQSFFPSVVGCKIVGDF